MSNYLVTGAAGFIGSVLARRLINEGHHVVTVDNLSTGKKENIPQGCEFIFGNTYDESIINRLYDYDFDAIFHIAGQSSGEVSFDNPVYDLETNSVSTLLLLNMARKKGIKHFVYASSMSVYGEHPEELVDENSKTEPKSFYAVGKLASENYMRIYSKFGIRCTALRFFNVYGHGQNLDNLRQGMASIYLAMALNDKHIIVKGAGERFRDFVHVDDVVDACIKCLNLSGSNYYDYFNISTRRKTRVDYIIKMIKDRIDGVSVDYVEGTPGDQFGIYGDNEKAKKILKWEPTIVFEDGMNDFISSAIKEKGEKR